MRPRLEKFSIQAELPGSGSSALGDTSSANRCWSVRSLVAKKARIVCTAFRPALISGRCPWGKHPRRRPDPIVSQHFHVGCGNSPRSRRSRTVPAAAPRKCAAVQRTKRRAVLVYQCGRAARGSAWQTTPLLSYRLRHLGLVAGVPTNDAIALDFAYCISLSSRAADEIRSCSCGESLNASSADRTVCSAASAWPSV